MLILLGPHIVCLTAITIQLPRMCEPIVFVNLGIRCLSWDQPLLWQPGNRSCSVLSTREDNKEICFFSAVKLFLLETDISYKIVQCDLATQHICLRSWLSLSSFAIVDCQSHILSHPDVKEKLFFNSVQLSIPETDMIVHHIYWEIVHVVTWTNGQVRCFRHYRRMIYV